MAKLGKVETPLVGIRGNPVKMEESMELPITLGAKDQRRTIGKSFMVVKIDVPSNAIFGKPLLYKLSAVHSSWYLFMKFEMNKGITYIGGDQNEARRGCILVAMAAMQQSGVIILKSLEE